jgi:hypothetical protein
MSIIHSSSLNIHLGGTSNTSINLPNIPLYLEDSSPNYTNVVSYAYHRNKAVNIPDAYNNTSFDFFDNNRLPYFSTRKFFHAVLEGG